MASENNSVGTGLEIGQTNTVMNGDGIEREVDVKEEKEMGSYSDLCISLWKIGNMQVGNGKEKLQKESR